MSEELMQTIPTPIGRYKYYPTRATTLAQLKEARIISGAIPRALATKKPDGLIIGQGTDVMAVLEYKTAKELNSEKKIKAAIAQEIDVARHLGKILIVTDNSRSYWINAKSGHAVLYADQSPVDTVVNVKKFQDGTLSAEQISKFEELLDRINSSISETEDSISEPILLDPTPLARKLWQKIWVNTGKEPEKCLYNVVELFVFKFLSDLGVLREHNSFGAILKIRRNSASDALEQYASVSRKEIKRLFPAGTDKTTIINGTIFVNEKGEPNPSQSHLFGEVLDTLQEYDEKFGSFRHIQRDFKTRLYEVFLRQSAGVKSLGQYFTPRNVVRAMVRMADVSTLRPGSRICDPFCGVGGFLLETIADNPRLYREFEPHNGKVAPKTTLLGFDKGTDEKEDERTIILAKANMLIYFSDLIARHHSPEALLEFSNNAFNSVFHLLRSNLGTFSETNQDGFDLILTNPPYVTSGVGSLRRAIEESGLGEYYTSGGRGTEALAIEWIVKNLNPGAQAFVIVPDGLLAQPTVLKFIKNNCIVQAVISLPSKTFYSTPKKTYILVVRKILDQKSNDRHPVFAYFVNTIGETLDTYRFQANENDLLNAANAFNQFKGNPSGFQSEDPHCKIICENEFYSLSHWLIDRFWTDEEKKKIGAGDATEIISKDDFFSITASIQKTIAKIGKLESTPRSVCPAQFRSVSFSGDWMEYVERKTGWTKSEYRSMDTKNKEDFPLYTATQKPVAHIATKTIALIVASEETPILSFGSNGDGSAGTNFVFHTRPFYVSNDRTCIRIIDKNIDPEYVFYTLHGMKTVYGFSHSFKASKANLDIVAFEIPITDAGVFDLEFQRKAVIEYKNIFSVKRELDKQLKVLMNAKLTVGRFL